jgi:arylsulfatase A-like enzyme
LPKWDTLNADEKKLFVRQADVFAAYVAYTDHEIGRVIQAVEDVGKLDNTLIIYISGDNGTSAEGSTIGTPFDLAAIQAIDIPVETQLKFYDVWGSALTTPHMSVAWSWAFDTPFKWTKQVASFFGGTRQGMVMSWPNRIKDAGDGLKIRAYLDDSVVVPIADQRVAIAQAEGARRKRTGASLRAVRVGVGEVLKGHVIGIRDQV